MNLSYLSFDLTIIGFEPLLAPWHARVILQSVGDHGLVFSPLAGRL
jgi:hypothetical protein